MDRTQIFDAIIDFTNGGRSSHTGWTANTLLYLPYRPGSSAGRELAEDMCDAILPMIRSDILLRHIRFAPRPNKTGPREIPGPKKSHVFNKHGLRVPGQTPRVPCLMECCLQLVKEVEDGTNGEIKFRGAFWNDEVTTAFDGEPTENTGFPTAMFTTQAASLFAAIEANDAKMLTSGLNGPVWGRDNNVVDKLSYGGPVMLDRYAHRLSEKEKEKNAAATIIAAWVRKVKDFLAEHSFADFLLNALLTQGKSYVVKYGLALVLMIVRRGLGPANPVGPALGP